MAKNQKQIFAQTLNQDGYEIIIENYLKPFIDNHEGSCFVIQDNAPAHTSLLCREAMIRNQIKLIKLPPYSPDINTIGLYT